MNEYVPDILDKMIITLDDTTKQYEIHIKNIPDGRLLETYVSEIAHSIKTKCDEFACKNLNSKISLCIRVVGDVSILACTLLTKEISPNIIMDFRAINKDSGAGIVIFILSAEDEKEINDSNFLHIKNFDALNTDLSNAATVVKTTDGKTVNIRPVDTKKYEGVSLQDNLWKEVMKILEE